MGQGKILDSINDNKSCKSREIIFENHLGIG